MGSRALSNKEEVKLEFVEAIKTNFGLLTVACQAAGISFQTYRNWYKADKEFASKVDAAVTDSFERTTDMAENKLFSAISKGEMTGIIFYLKTKGKKRGYIERQEVTGKDGESLFAGASLKQIAKEIAKDE